MLRRRRMGAHPPHDRPHGRYDAGLRTRRAQRRGMPAMRQIEFHLDRDHVALHQLLKLAGVCDSGGAGKHLVASGVVRVDGVVELRKACKIRAGQTVAVGDVAIGVVA